MIRTEDRKVFITDDGKEFAGMEEAIHWDRIQRVKNLIDFPCKQDEVIASFIANRWEEIRKIMEGSRG